jgi:hypothetical protein
MLLEPPPLPNYQLPKKSPILTVPNFQKLAQEIIKGE